MQVHAPGAAKADKKTIQYMEYRSDIDGLRAVAVVSVVCFHATPQIPSGGFVGVDVFFVISGFLITTIIANGLWSGNFSFLEFYARRIRRIFPALTIVLAACLAFGWHFLFVDEYSLLGEHSAAAAGFISNFVFWKEANYFDVSAASKPLLHLWSLGIEEQYYLLWPAVLWIGWRYRLNLATLTFIGLLASFVLNVKLTGSDPTAAFYSPLTRSWELLYGSLLAFLTIHPPSVLAQSEARISRFLDAVVFAEGGGYATSHLRVAASLFGLTLLAISIFRIGPDSAFPGWWAIMPVAGTSLLIFAGPTTWINRHILANPVLVWLGLISYPLYLWHWPLLSFASIIQTKAPTPAVATIVVVATILLAWLTHIAVEIPVRRTTRRSLVASSLCVAMLCIGAFGILIFSNGGLGFRFDDRKEFAAFFHSLAYDSNTHVQERADISQNQCNFYDYASRWPTDVPRKDIDRECYTKHTDKAVMLWGDSHSAHLYYGLKQALPADVSTLLVFASGCRPNRFSEALLETNRCDKANAFARKIARDQKPDVVILASNSALDIDLIRGIASDLKDDGVKHVIAVGLVPYWNVPLYRILLRNYWPNIPRRLNSYLEQLHVDIDTAFKAKQTAHEPFEYINLYDAFCDQDGCLTYVGDDVMSGLVTFDSAHLRPAASLFLAEKALVPVIMRDLQNSQN